MVWSDQKETLEGVCQKPGCQSRNAFRDGFTIRDCPGHSEMYTFLKIGAITKKVTEITHFYGASFCCST